MLTLKIITLLSCSPFADAAIYINVAEHPARLECGVEFAATVFGPSYHQAAAMRASLALIGTITGLAAGINGGSHLWYLDAALIFSVVPFTFIAIMPKNKLLLDPERNRSADDTYKLLRKWGRLHAMRSGPSTVAIILFSYAATKPYLPHTALQQKAPILRRTTFCCRRCTHSRRLRRDWSIAFIDTLPNVDYYSYTKTHYGGEV